MMLFAYRWRNVHASLRTM